MEHAHNPSFGVPTLDQKYYDTVARMLLAGEDLHMLHGFRPLLYPMFLAVCVPTRRRLGNRSCPAGATSCSVWRPASLWRCWERASFDIGSVAWWPASYSSGARAALFRGGVIDRVELHVSYLSGFAAGCVLRAEAQGWQERPALAALRRIDHTDVAGAREHSCFHGGLPLFAAWRWWRSRTTRRLFRCWGWLAG